MAIKSFKPYTPSRRKMCIRDSKEAEDGTVAVRTRKGGDEGTLSLEAFLSQVKQEIAEKSTRV